LLIGKSGLFHSRYYLKLADFVPSLWYGRKGAGNYFLINSSSQGGRPVGHHRQWVVPLDHLIESVAGKVISNGAAFKTPRKPAPLNICLRLLTIRIHPKSPAFMRVAEVLQGRLLKYD
jgi:hypothetical protein